MAVAIGLVEKRAPRGPTLKRGTVPDNAGSRTRGWVQAVREAGVVLDHAPALADPVSPGTSRSTPRTGERPASATRRSIYPARVTCVAYSGWLR